MAKIKIEEGKGSAMSALRRLKPSVIVFSLLLCLFAGAAGYFYYKYKQATRTVDTKEEIAQLVETIGAVMELPSDETPTLATVTDREKLTDQPFFRKSENGDKVLIYTNVGRAILYRPSVGKIVDVTAINVQENSTAAPEENAVVKSPAEEETIPTPEATLSGPIKIAFLNGSTKTGVTQPAEEKILAAFPEGVVVVGKEKASKNTYQGIIVADISGKASARASEITTTLGGTMSAFPAEELIPGEADIVVIIGNAALDVAPETVPSSKAKPAAVESVDIVPKAGAAVQQ